MSIFDEDQLYGVSGFGDYNHSIDGMSSFDTWAKPWCFQDPCSGLPPHSPNCTRNHQAPYPAYADFRFHGDTPYFVCYQENYSVDSGIDYIAEVRAREEYKDSAPEETLRLDNLRIGEWESNRTYSGANGRTRNALSAVEDTKGPGKPRRIGEVADRGMRSEEWRDRVKEQMAVEREKAKRYEMQREASKAEEREGGRKEREERGGKRKGDKSEEGGRRVIPLMMKHTGTKCGLGTDLGGEGWEMVYCSDEEWQTDEESWLSNGKK